jgi:NAD(P)-dependent dehydrogenase (short-subunit alcohol dehydrogenase family)
MDYRRVFDLDGRVAVVIGGGSGIGEAASRGLAAHGARVICADRELEKATAVCSSLGGGHRARWIDITSGASVRDFFAQLLSETGRLDIVVVTPAVNVRKQILDYEDEEFDRVIELNLKGTLRVMREAGRIMATNGGGSLIALSSIRAQVVEPGQGVYAATKAGIVQLVRTMAAELGPKGVRVNAVAPGVVDTPLTQPIKSQPGWYQAYAEKTALGRWARMDEMAGPIVFLGSDASSYVTGSVLVVDGGWTAIDGRFVPPL